MAKAGECVGVLAAATDAADTQIELKRLQDDLDSLNYIVAHDLHAPLRTMQEIGRLLLDTPDTSLPDDTRALLQHLAQGTAKLCARTEQLARFARVTRQPLKMQRVCAADLVSSITAQLVSREQNRHVDVVMGPLPDVMADLGLIREVFTHLISNAFKFTRPTATPRIEIGGAREPGHVTYHVRDNGVGFDMKYASRLFGLFQRLHSEAQFEGLGAGLAIARRIVERHGGALSAEATAHGGATFTFRLPAAGDEPIVAA
jgi:light-regulated signal transduction histidine kinase (bacteriophytochrome)